MYRVIIVDDEEIVLDGLERILGKISGIELVAKFRDGGQVVEYLEKNSVDAVILDIRMPNMDGLEVAAWLSKYKPECSVVLISAFDDFKFAQKAVEYGVRFYLLKPIRFADVRKIMDQLLKQKTQREKKLLWSYDLKIEIEDLEIYHAFINKSHLSEEKNNLLFFSEYEISFDSKEYEHRNLNYDMVRIGITNIIRWCSGNCNLVLLKQTTKKLNYILLSESLKYFPQESVIKKRIHNLMSLDADVKMSGCEDAKKLIEKNSGNVAQDVIADEIITQAKKFIAQNLSKNISRDDVALAVHLDSAYFSKYFKKKTGVTFQDYLKQERISKVIELLQCGYKVQDAACEAGYHNRNYFNQIFKAVTGFNPTEYKKRLTDSTEKENVHE